MVTEAQPTDLQFSDLRFVWNVVRQVKSNAIAVGKETSLWGSGAGQMSRIDAVALALQKAGHKSAGCVLASDAFFPFPDGVEELTRVGVSAIIQPGGSINDKNIIKAANKAGIVMAFTKIRHFKH